MWYFISSYLPKAPFIYNLKQLSCTRGKKGKSIRCLSFNDFLLTNIDFLNMTPIIHFCVYPCITIWLEQTVIKSDNYIFSSLQVRHLYGLTVFENYLYATNLDNFSIMQINRFNGTDTQLLIRLENAWEIHVYHKRAQPAGKLQQLYCKFFFLAFGLMLWCFRNLASLISDADFWVGQGIHFLWHVLTEFVLWFSFVCCVTYQILCVRYKKVKKNVKNVENH